MKNMQKLLILLSTTAMNSAGVLSLMTTNYQENSTHITTLNRNFFSNSAIKPSIGKELNIYDENGGGSKKIKLEFIEDVAQYKIDTSDILLTNLVTSDGKAIDSESALFLLNELNIDATDDIFDYNYLKTVKAEVSNITGDIIKKNEKQLIIQNGSYILKFIDEKGKTLGQNYEINAKQNTDAFLNIIESNSPAPIYYKDLVYPGSPIEKFKIGIDNAMGRVWQNKQTEVPVIHGDNVDIPSNVKKFLSYQELIGWKISFTVNTVGTNWWNKEFVDGDFIWFNVIFTKGSEQLIYPKLKQITLVEK